MHITGMEKVFFSSINNVVFKVIFLNFFSNYRYSITTNPKQTVIFIPE